MVSLGAVTSSSDQLSNPFVQEFIERPLLPQQQQSQQPSVQEQPPMYPCFLIAPHDHHSVPKEIRYYQGPQQYTVYTPQQQSKIQTLLNTIHDRASLDAIFDKMEVYLGIFERTISWGEYVPVNNNPLAISRVFVGTVQIGFALFVKALRHSSRHTHDFDHLNARAHVHLRNGLRNMFRGSWILINNPLANIVTVLYDHAWKGRRLYPGEHRTIQALHQQPLQQQPNHN